MLSLQDYESSVNSRQNWIFDWERDEQDHVTLRSVIPC